jgi:hypothetical protein
MNGDEWRDNPGNEVRWSFMKNARKHLFSLIFLLCGLLTLFLYAIPFPHRLPFGDGGEFLSVSASLGIAHPSGYPLYVLGARAASILLSSHRAGLALFSILPALCVLFFLARIHAEQVLAHGAQLRSHLRGNVQHILLAGIAIMIVFRFALSPAFRFSATEIDVYAFNLLFASTFIVLLSRERTAVESRALILLSYLFGLSLCNHGSALLWFPVFLWALWLLVRNDGMRAGVSKGLFFFILGLTPYLYLPIRHRLDPDISWMALDTVKGLAAFLTREPYHDGGLLRTVSRGVYQVKEYFLLLVGELGFPLAAAGLAGFGTLFHRSRGRGIVSVSVFLLSGIVLALLVDFTPSELQTVPVTPFFLPSFLLVSSLAMMTVIQSGKRRSWVAPLFLCSLVIGVFLPPRVHRNPPVVRNRVKGSEYSQGTACFLAFETLRRLPENAVVCPVTDHLTFPLWYAQKVKGIREDVCIVQQNNVEKYIALLRNEIPPDTAAIQAISAGEDRRKRRPPDQSIPLESFEITPASLKQLIRVLIAHASRGTPVFLELARSLEVLSPFCVPEGSLFRLMPDRPDTLEEGHLQELRHFWNGVLRYHEKEVNDGRCDPGDRVALSLLLNEPACFLLLTGEYSEAEWYFGRALELLPFHEITLNNMAGLRFRQDNLTGAFEILRRNILFNPYGAQTFENMGYILECSGDDARALSHYMMSWNKGNRSISLQHRIADRLFHDGAYDAAVAHYERLFGSNPRGEKVAGFRAGYIHQHRNRPNTAVDIYVRVLEHHPDYGLCHLSLGAVLLRLGQSDRAREHLHHACADGESREGALKALARLEGR